MNGFPPIAAATLMICALAMAGCVGDGDQYPSLAIRDVERLAGTEPPRPAPDAVAPIVSAQDLSAIVTRARVFDQRFADARPGAIRLVRQAASAGIDSDIRARALVAVADLRSLHGETALVLADLDRLEAEAASAVAPIADIRAAQAEVAAITRDQDRAIAAIDTSFDPDR